MINFIENSLFFGAALSLAGYEVGLLLKKKFKMALFNPQRIAVGIAFERRAAGGQQTG